MIKLIKVKDKSHKQMPVPAMIVMDVALYLICMGVFLLYFYVLPHHYNNSGKVVASMDSDIEQFSLSDADDTASLENSSESKQFGSNGKSKAETGSSTSERIPNRVSNENTSEQQADTNASLNIEESEKNSEVVQSYTDDKINLTVSKVSMGMGSDRITYYVADVKVCNISYLRTGFASGEYGKNIRESVQDMAKDYNAILAMSGDYYGNSDTSFVIRNGVLYRDDIVGTDICVLFKEGTMKTYSPEEFDADEVMAAGAWQAWNFGPSLLDENGEVPSTFNTTSYLNSENPRAAIGYVEPGHYIFVTVDGRDKGYSRGVTLSELAGIMFSLDCKVAYNLDGGKSSAMVYDGEYVNQPADGGRTISDIIYIGEE